MSRVKINVDEGMDTASYFTNEVPVYKAVAVPTPTEGEPDGRIVFCVFTPMNGYDKGKLLHVPFGRIISIALPDDD